MLIPWTGSENEDIGCASAKVLGVGDSEQRTEDRRQKAEGGGARFLLSESRLRMCRWLMNGVNIGQKSQAVV